MGLKASRVGAVRLGEVIQSGRVARTGVFIGKALPAKVFRFSVVTPKKSFREASLRNRARRRCREAFRAAALENTPGVDLVVTARPAVLEVEFSALLAEAAELLGCYSS